ncbi:hypothetical protein OESDEN_06639 [Oesophagostomum dentatum]|uniref:Uncharacterized protein n=1 Tax=Oesophagostomum dentatum TaxID=61180 RepID=A0A0B1T873_OESDE|nr:hypothetical protein OESDEN_06639 [Oesophagostomum dentatum]
MHSFKSLFGLSDSNGADANQNRDHLRRTNFGGGGRWPGSGGPGGPPRNGKCLGSAQTESGVRRNGMAR